MSARAHELSWRAPGKGVVALPGPARSTVSRGIGSQHFVKETAFAGAGAAGRQD